MSANDESPLNFTLPVTQWNPQEAVSFEVAVENIELVAACYTSLLQQETAKPHNDPETVEKYRAAVRECTREVQNLRSNDMEKVASVREKYAQQAREMMAYRD